MVSHSIRRRPKSTKAKAKQPTAGSRIVLDSIRLIVQVLRVESRASETYLGLSAAQLFVLHKLAESEGASINDLAARTLTHQSSVSVVVQKLVKRGLVARSAASSDGRRSVLTLTSPGRLLLSKSPMAAQDRLISAIQQFSPERGRLLARLLQQLATKLAGNSGPAPMFFEDSAPDGGEADGSR